MGTQLSPENVDAFITRASESIQRAVESGETPLSSEASFRFLFAWELGRLLGFPHEYRFDLECGLYNSPDSDDKFLDLLVWTDPDGRPKQ